MTMSKNGPISADRLRSFVERIERMEEERKGIAGDIRDIYSEAKGVGYDVKTLRKVVQLRKMDAADRDEQEQLLDVYWHALTTVDRIEERAAAGETAREIAAAEGVSKSTAHRVSQKARGKNESAKTGQANKPTIISPPEAEHLPLAPSSGGEGEELCVPLGRDAPSDDISSTGFEAGNQAHEGEENGRSVDGNAALSEPQEGLGAGNCDMHDGAGPGKSGVGSSAISGLSGDFRGEGICSGDGAVQRGEPLLPAAGRLSGGVRGRLPVDQPASAVSGRLHEAVDANAGRGVDALSTPPLGAVGSLQGDRVASPEIDLTIPSRLDRRPESRRAGT